MVGAAPAEWAGSSGAVGGANRTRVLALEVAMAGMAGMASAYALATPAAKPSTARRLKSGMRAMMPWWFG